MATPPPFYASNCGDSGARRVPRRHASVPRLSLNPQIGLLLIFVGVDGLLGGSIWFRGMNDLLAPGPSSSTLVSVGPWAASGGGSGGDLDCGRWGEHVVPPLVPRVGVRPVGR